MAILEIVTYPSDVLKKVAQPVGEITNDIKKLVDDMFDTMYSAEGVGLAAPQVGVPLRIIVVDVNVHGDEEEETTQGPIGPKEHGRKKYGMINPVITDREGEIEWEEGCLSIPDFRLKMKRSNKVKVKFTDKDGRENVVDAKGLLAVAIQHEIDHLDGKLLIDNISRLKRDLYLSKMTKHK
jgi:peptide deformylase